MIKPFVKEGIDLPEFFFVHRGAKVTPLFANTC
jgi:hypothetical protein